jgi:hypothetical protein
VGCQQVIIRHLSLWAEPGLFEMCLQLTEEEKRTQGHLSGSVALITDGLNIERLQ